MNQPVPASPGPVSAQDWEQRYREANTPWDRGGPPPALIDLLGRLGAARGRRVLVPGAGHGHDALAFARAGFRTTAVDLAPSACATLRARAERAGLAVEVLEADVLRLPATLHAMFDLAWEQTCLCALPPERRADYVAALRGALVPAGTLWALLWNHGQPGGPPYDLDPALARALFAPAFEERGLTWVDPLPGSRVREFLLELRAR